jgi:ferredoxin
MLAKVREACPALGERTTFACGPAPLLDGMHALYNDLGLSERLVTESFGLPLAPPAKHGKGEGARISFTKSQVHVDADGRTSLLMMAERAGLKPTHGCRRGLCHSCEARLMKGTVRDLRTGMTVVGTGACVQLCISAAVTDVEVAL